MPKMKVCGCGAYVTAGAKACPCCGARIGKSAQKYRNERTEGTILGKTRKFDSRGEAHRAKALEMMQMAGEISGLTLQPRFVLVPEAKPPIVYIPDFRYVEKGRTIVEDFKSPATRADKVFQLKLRLWRWRGPCLLRLSMLHRNGGYRFEEIIPDGEPLRG